MSESTRFNGSTPRPTRRPTSPVRRRLLKAGAAAGLGLAAAPLLGSRPAQALGLANLTAPPIRQLSGPVEFWSRETQDNGARQPLINAHLAAFDRANGTTSTAQFMVFQESIQKTQAAIAAGSPPDLGQQGPDVTMQAALQTPFYTNDPIRSVLVKQMETAVRYGGPVFGTTPYMGEAEGKLLFSQPVGDVMNGKRTVDEAITFLDREMKGLQGR